MTDGAAQQSEGRSTPLPASKSGSRQWHPVSVVPGLVNIKGGYNGRSLSARSIQYQIDGETHTFLELDKQAGWFLKGVGGPKVQKGDLKAVSVLTDLRHAFELHVGKDPDVGKEPDDDAAVADEPEAAVAEGEDFDPMDAMDDLGEGVKSTAKMARPTPKPASRDKRRAVVVKFEIPTKPLCARGDSDEKRVIWVYRRPPTDKKSTGMLFLRVDCVEWLLAYGADELRLQGVTPTRVAPVAPQAGNCAAVAGLQLEFDFNAKAWYATFVAGSFAGTSNRLAISELDAHMWGKLRDEFVDGYFTRANMLKKKFAVKGYLTMWAEAVTCNESAKFDEMMASCANATPPRGEKRSWADTAVAAEEVANEGDTCFAAADGDAAVADSLLLSAD